MALRQGACVFTHLEGAQQEGGNEEMIDKVVLLFFSEKEIIRNVLEMP